MKDPDDVKVAIASGKASRKMGGLLGENPYKQTAYSEYWEVGWQEQNNIMILSWGKPIDKKPLKKRELFDQEIRYRKKNWPDPTEKMLDNHLFNAIWSVIKTWDIAVPGAYKGYMGATGNHARAIYDGCQAAFDDSIDELPDKRKK